MKKMLKLISILAVALLLVLGALGYGLVGAADYKISGQKSLSEIFEGNISIAGSESSVTVRSGSRVETVTILGDRNIIRIEDGAEVGAIRGLGRHNRIYAAEGMQVDTSLLRGEDNKFNTLQPLSLDGL